MVESYPECTTIESCKGCSSGQRQACQDALESAQKLTKDSPVWCIQTCCREPSMAGVDLVSPEQCEGCDGYIMTPGIKVLADGELERSIDIFRALELKKN